MVSFADVSAGHANSYSVETEDWAEISPEAKDLVRRLLVRRVSCTLSEADRIVLTRACMHACVLPSPDGGSQQAYHAEADAQPQVRAARRPRHALLGGAFAL